jgi:hypothetical protein
LSSGGDFEGGVGAEGVVIEGVLVSSGEGEDALAEHLGVGEAGLAGLAAIDEALGEAVGEPHLSIELGQEKEAGVGGEIASVESGLHALAGEEIQGGLVVTVCRHEIGASLSKDLLTKPLYERVRSISCLFPQ